MSGIQRRAIFLNKGPDGYFRISDWCRVTTSVGNCYEPYSYNRDKIINKATDLDYDWREMSNRIDDVLPYDTQTQKWDEVCIGGITNPIEGY